eukprot:10881989-Ditylum_brightwellii.AAC.1
MSKAVPLVKLSCLEVLQGGLESFKIYFGFIFVRGRDNDRFGKVAMGTGAGMRPSASSGMDSSNNVTRPCSICGMGAGVGGSG